MTTLDRAYELLSSKGPEYGPWGLSNHGPMAVEALAALGRDAAILPWLDHYLRSLDPQPLPGRAIDEHDWASALGRVERHPDWATLFAAELSRDPWREVVVRWTPRLAPGLAGGALHGFLRAAHAVRAVAAEDNPVRLRELAQGLAYWAACFYRVPGEARVDGRLTAAQALPQVALLPAEQRQGGGLITTALAQLASFEPFAEAGRMLDVRLVPAAEVLSDVTEVLAEAYLANAAPANLIALVHMVTGPSAVRLLLPHVPDDTGRLLVSYAWQAGCALFSAFATTQTWTAASDLAAARAELIDAAIATGDEHAIKFTEACLREDAARPAAIYRRAAADAVRRVTAGEMP